MYRKIKNKKPLFYIPEIIKTNVTRFCHDDVDHLGTEKVVESITRFYWFSRIRKKVKNYIQNCLKCIEFSNLKGCKGGT